MFQSLNIHLSVGLFRAKLTPLRLKSTWSEYEKLSSPWLHFHNLSTEMRERKKERQQERALAVKQERLEIKEQCFISQQVCLSYVTYNGRGQPSAQRGLSSPISHRLRLVLKHNCVSLQREPTVNHRAPEKVIRPLSRWLLLEAAQLPCREEASSCVHCSHCTSVWADRIALRQCF